MTGQVPYAQFDRPWLLILLLLLFFVPYFAPGSKGRARLARERLEVVVRCAVIILLVLALAGICFVSRTHRLTVLVLVDRSASIQREATQAAHHVIDSLSQRLSPKDQLGIILFGGDAAVERSPSQPLPAAGFSSVVDTRVTDLAGAIRLAEAVFPPEEDKRIVLITDGLENQGDARAEAETAEKMGVEIVAIPVHRHQEDEVWVERVDLPGLAYPKQPFYLKVHLGSTCSQKARLEIYRNNARVVSQEVSLDKGKNVFVLPQTAGTGDFQYRVKVSAEKDFWFANNQGFATVHIALSPSVLYVEGDPDPGAGTALESALRGAGIRVVRIDPREFPTDLPSLLGYRAVIFSDVFKSRLSPKQLAMIEPYVRTLGRGFLMLGGPGSFAPGGYAETPVEDILPVRMAIRSKKQMAAVSLVMLIDKSGSMGETEGGAQKIDMAREAALALVDTLDPLDEVGVVAFDSASQWVVPFQAAKDKGKIAYSIATLRAGGGTDMYPAVVEAEKALTTAHGMVKHVIILSDGETPPRDFKTIITRMAQHDVTISTVALGRDADLPFMASLASMGNGQSYGVRESKLLPQIFAHDFFTTSRRMIREESFHPVLREDHATVHGLDWNKAPLLAGYVVTEAKEGSTVPLESLDGDPLLAVWHVGTGRAAAFTSDAKARWGKNFLSWKGYSGFWEQVVRWIVGNTGLSPYWLSGRIDGHEGVVRVEVPNGFPEPGLSLIAPDQTATNLEPSMNPDGSYTIRFPLGEEGTYTVSATSSSGISSFLHLNYLYSSEYVPQKPNIPLLSYVTEKTGGLLANNEDEIPVGPTRLHGKASRELWETLLAWALILFLLGIAIRRVNLPLQRWLAYVRVVQSAAPKKEEISPVMVELLQAKSSVAESQVRRRLEITQNTAESSVKSETSQSRVEDPRQGVEPLSTLEKLKETKDRIRRPDKDL